MPSAKKNVQVRGLEWCVNERIFVLDEEADERLLDSLQDEPDIDYQDTF